MTPAALITGIISERGLVPKSAARFEVSSFLNRQGTGQPQELENGNHTHASSIPGFYALDLETVKDYLADRPDLGKRVGPQKSKSDWQVTLAFLAG